MSPNENDILHDVHNYGANLKNREIFLHNHFGSADDSNPGVEYRMSNTFIKNIRALDSQNNHHIIVHMHSIGGEWSDGMAMFDAIRMCNSHVTIIAYGQAESMSSILLQAADTRIMTENAYFMSHYGSSEIGGHYLSVQNWINYEKRLCDLMINIYSKRCLKGKFFKEKYTNTNSIDNVKNFLIKKLKDGDWYLNSEEAVYYGFADGVLGSRKYPSILSLKQKIQ